MKYKRAISAILLVAMLFCLAACGENILPPKEGVEATPAPMPTPAPTPVPTPFSGAINAVEFAQNPDAAVDAYIPVTRLAAQRDTAVYVHLSGPLGHAPDARDYLELYCGEEKLGEWAPDARSTEDCLCYILENDAEFSLSAGEYTVRAVVDDMSSVQTFSVQETRDVRVLLLPLRSNFGGEAVYTTESAQNIFALMQESLPVRNEGITVVRAPGMDLSAEEYDLRTGRGMWMAWEAVAARAGVLGNYDLVVGLVSGEMGKQADCAYFGLEGVCLLDVTAEDPGAVLVRCAAETFGLTAQPGSAESWDALLDTLAEEDELPTVPKENTGYLRVTGLLGEEGFFAPRSIVPAEKDAASVTELTQEGSFTLRFTDASGTVLQDACFEPEFRAADASGAEKGFTPIDLRFALPEGATKLELFDSSELTKSIELPEAIWTLDLTMPELITAFTALPEDETLQGTVRVEWKSERVAAEAPEEETEEEEDGEKPEKLPDPEPEYELYMCFDGVQLLLYRGKLTFAELDMPSLPKPEEFTFMLLTSGGTWASVAASGAYSLT